MPHPDSSRVVHLKSAGLKRRGTGYWISQKYILTAGHAFRDSKTDEVSDHGTAYLGFDETPRQVKIVWRGTGSVDVALLALKDESLVLPGSDPVWASRSDTDLECVAYGRPKFLKAQREEFSGKLLRGANMPDKIHVEGRWIRSGDEEQWEGMSGAGLFCQGYLLGVITHAAIGRLIAFPATELLQQPGFPKHLLPALRFERFALWPKADQRVLERLQPWMRKRLLPSQRAPSELLLAENQVVEFDPSLRESELALLAAFTVEVGPELLILHGPGGAGKTRLMLEWCRQQRARGWISGFVDMDSDGVTQVVDGESPRLLVIDYPENRVELVAAICKRMLHQSRVSVRLVLLARSLGPWLDRLKQLTKTDAVKNPQVHQLGVLSQAQRRHTFQQACEAFQYNVAADEVEVTDEELAITDDLPLYAHMRALLRGSYGVQRPPEDPERLLREVLAHERNYWRQHIPEDLQDDAQRLMAAVTLLGSQQEGPAALLNWLRPALGQEGSLPAHQRAQLVDMAKTLYGRTGRVIPLQPDVLGEQLVLEAIEREQHLGDEAGERAWLQLPMQEKAPHGSVGRALTIWSHLASRGVQQARAWLGEVLTGNLGTWAKQAEGRTWAEDEQLDPRGHELAAAIASHGGAELAEQLELQLPKQTAELLPFRVEVLRILVGHSEGVPEPERARRLNNYGVYLSDAGRVKDGMAATLEAIDIRRKLTKATPRYLADLASTLNNLGEDLSSLGLVEDAMEATLEAITIRRKLAEVMPDTYLPGLASALNSLGTRLHSLARAEDAVEATLEAVDIRRELAETRPDAYLPDLAMALNNLGVDLRSLGRVEDAMEATLEAVDICRELAETRPDAYLPDLAMALNNLGVDLRSLGRVEDAMEATLEAVNIRRRLAEARPDAYLPDLASALNNLGSHLSSLGRVEDAMEATLEVVDIHRKLAEAQPAAYLADLAGALNNLGGDLSSLGRVEDAMEVTLEAVAACRSLVEMRPSAYLPDLASALNNLGSHLSSLGRVEDAMEATLEAVGIRRKLAETRPDTYLPDLAMALNNLGCHLNSLTRAEDAVETTLEAVDIRRKLAEARPDAYLPDLAIALNNLGVDLSSLGRVEDAMEATLEAVDIRRKLAETRPAAYLADLAIALDNLGSHLSSLGRVEDAMEAALEAVGAYRKLAEARSNAYLPDLANALNNLGADLSSLGRVEDAMEATLEVVDIRRKLAETRSDIYLPDLARSLAFQGTIERQSGQLLKAIECFAEALNRMTPLLERHPQAHEQLVVTLAQLLSETCEMANIDVPEDLAPLVSGTSKKMPSR